MSNIAHATSKRPSVTSSRASSRRDQTHKAPDFETFCLLVIVGAVQSMPRKALHFPRPCSDRQIDHVLLLGRRRCWKAIRCALRREAAKSPVAREHAKRLLNELTMHMPKSGQVLNRVSLGFVFAAPELARPGVVELFRLLHDAEATSAQAAE